MSGAALVKIIPRKTLLYKDYDDSLYNSQNHQPRVLNVSSCSYVSKSSVCIRSPQNGKLNNELIMSVQYHNKFS